MKIKCFFILLLVLFMLPVSAGQLEQKLKSNNNVCLYIYKEDCGLCQLFNPIYNKLTQKYASKYGFLKVNSGTVYGRQLVQVYKVRYVPYVVLIHSKDKKTNQVDPRCLVNESCVEKAFSSFYTKYNK